MLFASTFPTARRNVYSPGFALERFLNQAVAYDSQSATHYQQDDKDFRLSLDIPGIAREQLSITIEAAVVRIESLEGAPRKYRAAYELPQEIDAERSEAKLENGVLQLRLAKKVPPATARTITIQ